MTKEDIISEVLKHRNYGQEQIFKKHFPINYQEILKMDFPDNFYFVQKLYHYLYNDFDLKFGICPECGKRSTFRSFPDGYMTYCSSKCAQNSNNVRNNIMKTNMSRYGCTCSLGNEFVKQKREKTWINNYGTDNPAKSEKIQKKIKKTNVSKYCVEHPLQNDDVQKKMKQTCLEKYGVEYYTQCEDYIEKTKITNLEKYGVEHVSQSDYIKNKKIETCLEHYGVQYPQQNADIKEKTKITNLEKYGVMHVLQDVSVREKIKKTCLKEHGVEYYAQTDNVKEKIKITNLEKYGVPYACMRAHARKYTNDSKPNKYFAEKLEMMNIPFEREFRIGSYSYDFKIGNTLVEINPTITHNSYLNIFGNDLLSENYHFLKTKIANDNGCSCIHIWDWINVNKVAESFLSKQSIYADNIELKKTSESEVYDFLSEHCFKEVHSGDLQIGLFVNNTLLQVGIFNNILYKEKSAYELVHLCTHTKYNVLNGYEKIIKYVSDISNNMQIICIADCSSLDYDTYLNINFSKICDISPLLHWYNRKTHEHIIDNNSEAYNDMIDKGFLPIYDAGHILMSLNL